MINRSESVVPKASALVEVRRGSIVESRHRGHIVAVDGSGKEIARLGDPTTVTFMRSSAKPHQALPLIATGAADRFQFTDREIAIACGSHSGEPIHAETVFGMLRKIGLDEKSLKCGVHEPFDRETARKMNKRGERPSPLQNNCSGKHAAMLALAVHLGAPVKTYDHPQNPVQLAAIETISQFSAFRTEDIALGVDGCGVPVFGLSIVAMALMYARLVLPPATLPSATIQASKRIVDAMGAYPELVGGTRERFDTEVMRATQGRVVSKVGAEGVYTAGVLPCDEWPKGLGLAFKIEDGEDRRARPTVAIESLRQLGVLDGKALESLAPYSKFPISNHRGDIVGEIRPNFELERSS
jgi:L-asparaginase II